MWCIQLSIPLLKCSGTRIGLSIVIIALNLTESRARMPLPTVSVLIHNLTSR